MDAIILAAGLGTRLRPHTLTVPKPLLPVQGRPILDWTLGALPVEVDRVIVVVHYLKEQVEEYLRTQKHFREHVAVWQQVPRGTGDALLACKGHLRGGPFLVMNGDDLFGAADLKRMVKHAASLLCHEVHEPRKFGIAFLREDGALRELIEKPDMDGTQLANTGAYVFPQNVFENELTLSQRGEYEITQYVSALAGKGTVSVEKAEFWFPIGDEKAWDAAQKLDLNAAMTGRK
jgi:bifunctional UDP-N-acetylglucosamine pyrophosphorylase/glucosamine-1-phosphate N-acetyltransferase